MGISIEFASPDIFYALACFTYIIVGITCGIIRWCHMCHPYDKQADFFYPARRQVTFYFAATVLQFPYILCPHDADLWFYVRSFGIIYYPMCAAMMFHRYFRLGHGNRNWLSRFKFSISIGLLVVLMLLSLFHTDDTFSRNQLVWECVMGGISLLLTMDFVIEGRWLNHQIDNYHTQNYSNDSDFPYAFAKKVIYQPLGCFLLMWIVFLTDSRMVKMIVDLLLAAWMLLILCMILHPNRMIHSAEVKEKMEKLEAESLQLVQKEDEETENQVIAEDMVEGEKGTSVKTERQIQPEEWDTVRQEVLTIVSRRYLEPSLKRVEVIGDVRKSTHSLAGKFITEIGFYQLVNAFRIRHYEQLMQDAPAAMSQEMAAEKCGFKNRWALSNACKRMKDFDYSLIEEYL